MPEDNVIPFPTRLRVVGAPPPEPTDVLSDIIGYDGRIYRATDLLTALIPAEREQIDSMAPRTAQAAWDMVVGKWPALAAEIAVTCQPVG